jgi:hypothetical protein
MEHREGNLRRAELGDFAGLKPGAYIVNPKSTVGSDSATDAGSRDQHYREELGKNRVPGSESEPGAPADFNTQ